MLNDEQIKVLTNHFVKMCKGFGFDMFRSCGSQIALFHQEDGWSIELVEPTNLRLKNATMHFDYPLVLPEDEWDAAIELAGLISIRLHDWMNRSKIGKAAGKASASKLTPEQRRERAKKAVAARIAKYGQKTGNAGKADGSRH